MRFARSRVLTLIGSTLLLSAAVRADAGTCPYGKLEWADFQGTVPGNSTFSAFTVVNMPSSWGDLMATQNGNMFEVVLPDVSVEALFDKRGSWSKPGDQTPALLQHEQYHLDIAQHWAKELEKLLKAVKGVGATAEAAYDDAEAKAEAAIKKCDADCEALEKAYDHETAHGTNTEKQAEWCKKIGDLLNPPKPEKDVAESDERQVQVETGDEGGTSAPIVTIFPSTIDSFSCEGIPFLDPLLIGGTMQLPQLAFEGYHMNNERALLIPPGPDQVVLFDPFFTPVLVGHLRLLMSDEPGLSYTGWIQNVQIDPLALGASPFLQLVEQTRLSGEAIVTVELLLGQPLELSTNNWTTPGFELGQLGIGTAVDGPETWQDLGFGLAGTEGEPNLFAVGDLVGGEPLVMVLNDAFPSSIDLLVVGFSPINLPFFGGTLVPNPNVVLGPFPIDPLGDFIFSAPTPPGLPSGLTLFFQSIVADPGAPLGASLSNGLAGTTP